MLNAVHVMLRMDCDVPPCRCTSLMFVFLICIMSSPYELMCVACLCVLAMFTLNCSLFASSIPAAAANSLISHLQLFNSWIVKLMLYSTLILVAVASLSKRRRL